MTRRKQLVHTTNIGVSHFVSIGCWGMMSCRQIFGHFLAIKSPRDRGGWGANNCYNFTTAKFLPVSGSKRATLDPRRHATHSLSSLSIHIPSGLTSPMFKKSTAVRWLPKIIAGTACNYYFKKSQDIFGLNCQCLFQENLLIFPLFRSKSNA